MRLSDFDYQLPPELIAQHPLQQRGSSRLLVVEGGQCVDANFANLGDWLRPNDLLVFNDTRVMQARLYARKETGGQVEILIERLINPQLALAHLKVSKKPKAGMKLLIADGDVSLYVNGRRGELFELQLDNLDFSQLMMRHGHVPLPPYITRNDEADDLQRYQTVYAKKEGAVAAPTAGLHFDQTLLENLKTSDVKQTYVTLHVGAGTFQPVRSENLEEHRMHSEQVWVNEEVCEAVSAAKRLGGRVIAVGTTSVRSLETAAATGELKPYVGESRLFIRPGYQFNCVDAMITNFHLPKSTLLMLVSAFAGMENIRSAYRHAIQQKYRFFSYGDAMFLSGRMDHGE